MFIRLAAPDDAAAIAEIYRPYVENTSYTFEYEAPDAGEYRARMEKIQAFFPFFVYEEDGRLLGFAYAHFFHERAAFQWACETSVYVDMSARGRGVGHALYKELLPALADMGFCKAYAVLGCPNEASERFHLREGFVREGELKDIGFKLGGWHDVLYLAKTLRAPSVAPTPPRPYTALGKH